MRFLATLTAILITSILCAQKGFISGTVTEKDNADAPALGAIIRVDCTSCRAPAGFDGKYKISVPP